jgi:hypothetical protein
MLGDFQHQPVAVIVGLKRVQDLRQMLGELQVTSLPLQKFLTVSRQQIGVPDLDLFFDFEHHVFGLLIWIIQAAIDEGVSLLGKRLDIEFRAA